ncbi:MAG: hypothetical protein ABSG95_04175 [Solirubrobacteraceae bacterium]|jgi:hypothetical protein
MSTYSRRTFLTRSAAGAAGLAVASPTARALAAPLYTSFPTKPAVKPGALADAQTLQKWSKYLAGLNPRYTGNEAHQIWIDDLASAMHSLGWTTTRNTQTFSRWYASSSKSFPPLKVGRSLNKNLPVASNYPYSGQTPYGGVVGELAYAGKGKASEFVGSFAGKIAVIDVAPFEVPFEFLFTPYFGFEEFNPALPYDRSWLSVGPSLAAAQTAGARGAIIILPDVVEDAEGQYGPFKSPLQGLPAVNVDLETGNEVRELAKGSENFARLTLPATVEENCPTDSLLAVLPGSTESKDVVVVNTHTDGPCLIEENGGLAMISIAQLLSAIPQAKRKSTFAFYFATGHFAYGVTSSGAYVTEYPELFEHTKAGVTLEHLGCPEYLDDHVSSYGPTGLPEARTVFASNLAVAEIAQNALRGLGVTRCTVDKPTPEFFGEGAALNAAGIPMMSFIAGPDYLLATRSTKVMLERFDVDQMVLEIEALTQMILKAAETPKESLT